MLQKGGPVAKLKKIVGLNLKVHCVMQLHYAIKYTI